MKTIKERCSVLFDKLVPGEGPAATVEGEMLRAINRIGYRYLNDGDYFWRGYGTETAGPQHAYLTTVCPIQNQLSLVLNKADGKEGDVYETVINKAIKIIVEYVECCGDNLTPNTTDSYNCKPLFTDDEDDDEEDDW
jgi:hypothetical protein